VEKRIDDLVKKLTLQEKISLVAGVDNWHTAVVKRLGIPAIKVTDGPHGARTADEKVPDRTLPATCFPNGVTLAATWNPEIVKKVGAAIGAETRARGCAILLGPCVNIHRSPLGGRNFESYSEDPYLSSRIVVAFINGVQSKKVSACVKHLALNNQEYQRMTISSDVDERTMREIYFPSFEKAVKEAGVWSVMCSYNKINGTFAADHRWLLTELLKDEWGFNGLLVSDWFAVHSTAPAANAGVDLEMPGPARFFGKDLADAVKKGQVTEKTIDDKVRRLLRLMLNTGALDGEIPAPDKIKDFPAHRALAREAAEEGIVLLKNDNNVLPLNKKSVKTIAVIGPNAAEAGIQGGGSAQVNPYYKIAPLDAIKNLCGNKVKIVYELGCASRLKTHLVDPLYISCGKDGKKPGLTGEYFNNSDFSGKPALTQVDTSFEFRWMPGEFPNPALYSRKFSIRWQGFFKAPETGRFKFGLLNSDWARVYIDGKLVCGNWNEHREINYFISTETVGEVALQSGKIYPIKIEFSHSKDDPWPLHAFRLGCDLPLPAGLLQRAVKAAKNADAAIVFAGLTEEYESEGYDRKEMPLPAAQNELIVKVAKANPNTVVVLNNGSPVAMPWINKVPAVVEALFPGQECGNAIAAVLFGDVNPSGKLPDTYPVRYEDNPAYINYPGENGKVPYGEGIFVGYRYYDAKKIEPLWAFGHGLSYTDFAYGNLKVTPVKAKAGQKITVSIDVMNAGKVAGKEVVQLYVGDTACRVRRPPKELKAFEKISLAPGELKTVVFKLAKDAFSFYDTELKDWAIDPGEFEILVGSSSRDIRAKQSLTLTE
jgi:beta-glucosidase